MFAILGTVIAAWLVYQLRDIIVLLLIVLTVTIVFSPIVKSWEQFVPRPLAIVILYLVGIGLVAAMAALFVPPLLRQVSDFATYVQNFSLGDNAFLSHLSDNLGGLVEGKGIQSLTDLLRQFQGSVGAVFSTTLGFITGLIALVTVFISSFYLLLDENNLGRFIASFLSPARSERVMAIIEKISRKISGWLRGQIILMLVVGLIDGLGLALLGAPYPLLLGVWSGLTEAVPVVGPILGALPAVVLSFVALGWLKALFVLALYVAVQQVENHVLVPKIMGRVLGLSPVTIIFALLIGGNLLGFLGIILAIPVTAVISVFLDEWRPSPVGR